MRQETDDYVDGYKMATELRDLYGVDPDARRVIDVARGFEGLRRQDGIHAAAVVITKAPVTEYVPIQRKPGPNGNIDDAPVVTQFEMHGVEDLGLLKMDFLGLKTLSELKEACKVIKKTVGDDVDLDTIPIDDELTALDLLETVVDDSANREAIAMLDSIGIKC